MPCDLVERIRERDECAEAVALAQSAVENLRAATSAAEAELAEANRAASQAATTLLREFGAQRA